LTGLILACVKSIEIDTFFGDKPVHLEVSQTMGTGEVYQVVINKFYNGRIWKTRDGWLHDLNSKTIFHGDDVQILIDLIRGEVD
jgi:hypothetical protein